MRILFKKIEKRPMIFLRLFGLCVQDFEKILNAFEPLWQKEVIDVYKRPGRYFKLDLADMLLMTLLYYRTYTTQIFIGYLFGLDDSRVCRLIKRIEPILAQIISIKKRNKLLDEEEIESLLIDATEQTIERPKKFQKLYYSGKKKKHTLKTEIRTTVTGRIMHVSKTRPGSWHDYKLHKQEPAVEKKRKIYVDSGYQGLDKQHKETYLPYKSSKKKLLNKKEKEHNRLLSSIRIKVENVFAQMKTFKILADRYRNKKKRYNLKVNIIAGIVNLKNGFA